MTKTLILVPGLGCDRRLWAHQAIMMGDDARLIIADQTRHDSIKGMAVALLADAPDRFAIAGLSMGGYVALEVFRQARDRVAGIALLDTNAHADKPERLALRQQQIDDAAQGRLAAVVDAMMPLLVAPAYLDVPAVAGVYRAMALDGGADVFIRQQQAIIGRADSMDLLGAINVPSLVLCGEHDALSSAAKHRDMAACMPGAALCVVPRAGHLATLEAPVPVTQAMQDWLDKVI